MNSDMAVSGAGKSLDIDEIKRLLPHRPPLLMIDRLTDIVPGESATGWKAVQIGRAHV